MQLTEHFSLEEMTRSNTARNRGIDNTPSKAEVENLKKLCVEILEPIRMAWGKPIIITSGFRSYALNRAVGGAKTSQHLNGCAVDFKTHNGNHSALFEIIKKMIKKGQINVGQLIWEYGNKSNPKWVHVSLPRENKENNQILYLGVK